MSGTIAKESLEPGARAWIEGVDRIAGILDSERTVARTVQPALRAWTRTPKPRWPEAPVRSSRGLDIL